MWGGVGELEVTGADRRRGVRGAAVVVTKGVAAPVLFSQVTPPPLPLALALAHVVHR